MPTYIQIPYDPNGQFTWHAYQKRTREGLKSGKNIATVKLRNGTLESAWSMPEVHMHSEAAILTGLIAHSIALSEVEWIYTERMPCGYGPGLANCRALLNQHFDRNVPVYFTAPYYDGDDKESIAVAVLASKFSTEINRSMYNKSAQGWRKEVARKYPMWSNVWAQTIPPEAVATADMFSAMG